MCSFARFSFRYTRVPERGHALNFARCDLRRDKEGKILLGVNKFRII